MSAKFREIKKRYFPDDNFIFRFIIYCRFYHSLTRKKRMNASKIVSFADDVNELANIVRQHPYLAKGIAEEYFDLYGLKFHQIQW